jgi:hypothetical protein
MSNEIMLRRGNDLEINLTVFDNTEIPSTPINFTLYAVKTVTMYVRAKSNDANNLAIITKTGTITDAPNGVVEFTLVPADTNVSSLKDNTSYTAEFIAMLDGLTYTVLLTKFTLVSM